MFINASPDSRSLDMVDLRYVFNLLSVLNERSHSADWWEGRHPQYCTTFSSIARAQHQPREEKQGRFS